MNDIVIEGFIYYFNLKFSIKSLIFYACYFAALWPTHSFVLDPGDTSSNVIILVLWSIALENNSSFF